MRVLWTGPARDRLAEIEEYIALDAPGRAADFVLELLERAEQLSKFPDSGRIVPEDEQRLRREVVYEGYRIIYRIERDTVYVLSVFEGSRLIRPGDLK